MRLKLRATAILFLDYRSLPHGSNSTALLSCVDPWIHLFNYALLGKERPQSPATDIQALQLVDTALRVRIRPTCE